MKCRQSLVVLLIALGLVLSSVACAGGGGAPAAAPTSAPAAGPTEALATAASPAETVELVFQNWTQAEMPFETELIQEFEKSHPNIRIKLSVGPYDQHHDKIIAATKAGMAPDVFEIIPEQLIGFVTQKAVLSLDEYVEKEGGASFSGQYLDSAWGMVYQGGHVYGLPWRYGPSAMFINVKMFEDAGVPLPDGENWTWDDLLAIAKELTNESEKQYGFAYSATKDSFGTSWEWFCHLFASGGELIKDGKPAINSEAAVESLTWWTDLLLKEKVVPPETPSLDETAIVDMVGRGKVAMWANGPWYINNFRSSYPDVEIATVPMPKGIRDGSSAGGTFIAVSPDCKHPAEAWEFIKWMTSEETLREWATRGNFMPTRKDILQDQSFQEPPMLAFTQVAMRPNTRVIGVYPDTATLFKALHGHMQEVLLGQKTPKEALDATAKEWEATLADYQ